MKSLLKLEYLAEFLLGFFLFKVLSYDWWWFPLLLFTPDISMIGYLINPKVGAYLYNFFHHKGLGVVLTILGMITFINVLSLAGAIILAHIGMDRFFGFGLKHRTGFKDTHLGKI